MTSETGHPGFEYLIAYVEGRLTHTQHKQVQQHLDAGCTRCQADLIWLNHTLGLLAQNEWQEPPAALQMAARQVFRHRSQPAKRSLLAFGQWLRPLTRPQPRWVFSGSAILLILLLSGLLFLLEPGLVPSGGNTSVALGGNVEIQSQGEDEWQPAPSAHAPRSGDLFRTKSASTATLTFFGRSVTRLDANTAVAVTSLHNSAATGDAVVILHQWEGQTENSVGLDSYSPSELIIQTPAATVTGEYASFITNVARNGDTTVFVRQGEVVVTAEGISTTLLAGQAASIQVGTAPVTVALNVTPSPTPTGTPTPTPAVTVPPTYTPASINPPATYTPVPATPAGNSGNPPGQSNNPTPPSQANNSAGQGNSGNPPGQSNTPPGQDNNPPGQDNNPANPGNDGNPPGQNKP